MAAAGTARRRTALVAAIGLGVSVGSVALASAATADVDRCSTSGTTVTCNFFDFGAEQTFVVPSGVTSITVQADGAPAGAGGGHGASVTGTLAVTPGHTLYIEVGGLPDGATGGFNGGGGGTEFGFAGGGASDVRTIARDFAGTAGSRKIVAGGGGGAGNGFGDNCNDVGGDGGDAGSAGDNGFVCTGTGGSGGRAGMSGVGGQGGTGDDDGALSGNGANGTADTGGTGGGSSGGGGGGGYGGGGGGGNIRLSGANEGGAGGGGGGGNLVPSGGTAGPSQAIDASVSIQYHKPATGPTISGTPPTGNLHEPYSFTFQTTGATPRSVSKSAGTLPPGLTLNSAGKLSGTPTKAGSYQFTARVSNSQGSATRAVTLVIRPVPAITITGGSVTEGNSGTRPLPFTVKLNRASALSISVKYATAKGSAAAPSDYTAKSGTLTFSPGQTSKTVNVLVKGDTTKEATEVFHVALSSPTNASIGVASAAGNIRNDD
jgi:hypothetical protein